MSRVVCKASGQIVNYQKSSVSFSANTQVGDRDFVCSILNVSSTDDHGNYLGLPSIVG